MTLDRMYEIIQTEFEVSRIVRPREEVKAQVSVAEYNVIGNA